MTSVIPFDGQTLLTYCLAAAALVIAPGPGQALVLARSIEGGARAGFLTSVGLATATLGHTFLAALGLSAVLAASATAFAVVKYAGAAYLVTLGILTLRRSAQAAPVDAPVMHGRRRAAGKLVFHGAVTGALNPKVAVFMMAFLPQFVDPERGAVTLQFVVLGTILMLMGMVGDFIVALASGRARDRLLSSPRLSVWRERFTGTVLVGLGMRLALVEGK